MKKIMLILLCLVAGVSGADNFSLKIGQSNQVGQANGYTTVVDTNKSKMYLRSNKIKGMVDPVHVDSGTTVGAPDYNGASITKASCDPAMANKYTSVSNRVYISIPSARSSTGLILDENGLRVGYRWLVRNEADHDDSTNCYGKSLVNLNRAIAIRGWNDSSIIWIHYKGSEADAAIAASDQTDSLTSCYNQVYNGIRQLYTWYVEDLSNGGTRQVKMIVYGLGRRNSASTNTAAWETVDRALHNSAVSTSGIYWGGSQKSYPLVDGYVHLDSAGQNKMGRIGAQIMLYDEGFASYYKPPKITSIVAPDYDRRHIKCTITHYGGTAITPTSGDLNAYAFTMSDGTAITYSKITGQSVDLHLAKRPSSSATVRYMWGDNKTQGTPIYDNSTVAFDLDPLYDSGYVMVTTPTLPNSKSKLAGKDFEISVDSTRFFASNPYLMQYFDLALLSDSAWSRINFSGNNIQILRTDTICDAFLENFSKANKKGIIIFGGYGSITKRPTYKVRITTSSGTSNWSNTIFTKLQCIQSYSLDSIGHLVNRVDNTQLTNNSGTNAAAKINTGLSVVPSADAYDATGNFLKYPKTQPFTIFTLLKVNAGLGGTMGLVTKYAATGNGLQLFINTSGSISFWYASDYGTGKYLYCNAYSQTISGYTNWRCASVTYNGDYDARGVTITYDTSVYGTNVNTNGAIDSVGVTTEMCIGKSTHGAAGNAFNGILDETMVFNRSVGDSTFVIPLQKNLMNMTTYWRVDSVGTVVSSTTGSSRWSGYRQLNMGQGMH